MVERIGAVGEDETSDAAAAAAGLTFGNAEPNDADAASVRECASVPLATEPTKQTALSSPSSASDPLSLAANHARLGDGVSVGLPLPSCISSRQRMLPLRSSARVSNQCRSSVLRGFTHRALQHALHAHFSNRNKNISPPGSLAVNDSFASSFMYSPSSVLPSAHSRHKLHAGGKVSFSDFNNPQIPHHHHSNTSIVNNNNSNNYTVCSPDGSAHHILPAAALSPALPTSYIGLTPSLTPAPVSPSPSPPVPDVSLMQIMHLSPDDEQDILLGSIVKQPRRYWVLAALVGSGAHVCAALVACGVLAAISSLRGGRGVSWDALVYAHAATQWVNGFVSGFVYRRCAHMRKPAAARSARKAVDVYQHMW